MQYFASIDGELVGLSIPKMGLQQGDPLSPYLFIICVEGLSTMLQQVKTCGDLHGCRLVEVPLVSPIYYLLMIASFSLMSLNKNVARCIPF